MKKFNNAMEVFKLLEKNNCKKCNRPTCLAFAADVFKGQAVLSECPLLDKQIIAEYGDEKNTTVADREKEYEQQMNQLKKRVSEIDLEQRAHKIGGTFSNGRLTIRILGKKFSVDSKGDIFTDIHVNPWIAPHVYNYILKSEGKTPAGEWVSLRELKSGKNWYNFFHHKCEKPLKKVADTYTSFFEDIIKLFNGCQVENHYDADISLIIHPLPKLPVLICYNNPDEGLDSDLKLFFDRTAEDNLNIESIYGIGVGLSIMFEKLSLTHG